MKAGFILNLNKLYVLKRQVCRNTTSYFIVWKHQ